MPSTSVRRSFGSRPRTQPSGLEQVARARRATHVVIPYREVRGLRRFTRKPLADTLIERLPEIEVHVVGAKPDPKR
jgi:K+-sensing histidine kinase KdpD